MALGVCVALAACSSDPPSQLRVHLDAQTLLKERVRELRVRVWSGDRSAAVERTREITAADLPGTVVLVREGSRRVVLEAALADDTGTEIAWTRFETAYVDGQLREVALCFEDVCRGVECNGGCAAGEGDASTACTRCSASACVPATAVLLPPGTAPNPCADTCEPAPTEAAGETACGDGEDGDCDGNVDCADPQCEGQACGPVATCMSGSCACPGATCETDCGNGADDDGDGALDCADSDCEGSPCMPNGYVCVSGGCDCRGGRPTEDCTQGDDLDCDGMPGCADPDCDGRACATDLSRACCGGTCVSVHTAENCGACGIRCPGGRICGGGSRPACRCGVSSDCPELGVYQCNEGLCSCQGPTACTGEPFDCVPAAGGNYCRPRL